MVTASGHDTATVPVRLRPSTKARLDLIKVHRRETVDDVVARLLDLVDMYVRPGKRESAEAKR